jgi:hypothetical protein
LEKKHDALLPVEQRDPGDRPAEVSGWVDPLGVVTAARSATGSVERHQPRHPLLTINSCSLLTADRTRRAGTARRLLAGAWRLGRGLGILGVPARYFVEGTGGSGSRGELEQGRRERVFLVQSRPLLFLAISRTPASM